MVGNTSVDSSLLNINSKNCHELSRIFQDHHHPYMFVVFFNARFLFPLSKKSPTGPTERTPNPEYLIALAIHLGVRW